MLGQALWWSLFISAGLAGGRLTHGIEPRPQRVEGRARGERMRLRQRYLTGWRFAYPVGPLEHQDMPGFSR